MKKPIYLVPVGTVEEALLEAIAQAVERTFDRPCRVGVRLVDPMYAYDRRRRLGEGMRWWLCPVSVRSSMGCLKMRCFSRSGP